jgi:predicted NBD/HSP70 family sugar kinase
MQHNSQIQGSPRAIREINRSIVIELAMRNGPVSRADLARWSTLTKPTISAIVDGLLADDLLKDVGFSMLAGSKGRRTRLVEFNAASAAYLGVELEPHKATVGVADARGMLRAWREVGVRPGDPPSAARRLLSQIDGVCSDGGFRRDRLRAAGVTVHGTIDDDWAQPLEAALGVPVILNSLAGACAIAEGRGGVARGLSSYVWLHIGTTVSACIVSSPERRLQVPDARAEIGHCWVADCKLPCRCGKQGCLESLVSSEAIAQAVRAALLQGEPTSLSALSEIDVETVARHARAGDDLSRRVFERVGGHLGTGISYLARILDPELIVIGGPVVRACETLLGSVRRVLDKSTLARTATRVAASTLGNGAGLLGTVVAAQESALRSYRIAMIR